MGIQESGMAMAWHSDNRHGQYEASPPQPPFDICLQDDSNGAILKINSSNGAYQFTNCSGVILNGVGTLIKRGSAITLQHYGEDRRVLAKMDAGRGTASVRLISLGITFNISDRNTANNPCACTAP
jgi:hypothetical protein